ncbi:VOC family protein [Streptomyces sp. NRRL WC-3549]|uniref:VOC family protein n=1 Tax=Streptomyces sp. NRRL WC-3549 TaxID=1463925 RepID=UPI0004CB2FAE|nr:VOC family protein [Streptomyces sp. NRRL WC-3549]
MYKRQRPYRLAVDAHDFPLSARFWCAVLDWKVLFGDEEEIVIGAADETAWPGMCFLPVPEGKTVKNRLHIDLAPDDRDAEVERIIGLGARRVDVGEDPGVTWAVLADPEGNEFCVLSPKDSLVD